MPRTLEVTPQLYKDLKLPEGMELRSLNTVFDDKFNADRKKINHVRRVSQHLASFYGNHFPDSKIINSCSKLPTDRQRKVVVPHYIWVYRNGEEIHVASLAHSTTLDVLHAQVGRSLAVNLLSESDIIEIFYAMYPKPQEMDWGEWRKNASDGILADGCTIFRSMDYYEVLEKNRSKNEMGTPFIVRR